MRFKLSQLLKDRGMERTPVCPSEAVDLLDAAYELVVPIYDTKVCGDVSGDDVMESTQQVMSGNSPYVY